MRNTLLHNAQETVTFKTMLNEECERMKKTKNVREDNDEEMEDDELTDTAMKNVLMFKCLQRMKEVSVPWYNYFLKENYHLKIYGRHLTQAAIPLTTNGIESSWKYQKVTITVTIRSKHIPEV